MNVEHAGLGQAIYSRNVLAIYDFLVLGVSLRFAWRCPASLVLDLYSRHVSANHLDVGVGTGFFLDRCRFPPAHPRLGLMDVNPICLEVAGKRVARYAPEVYQNDVLEPIRLEVPKFDSASLSWLLHCLPGSIATKGNALWRLKGLLNPGAMVFGATLLHGGVRRNWLARRLMSLYNATGIFSNSRDDLVGLSDMLMVHLHEPSVRVVGCAALFSGRI
jgi:hypothetical protein